MADKGFTHLHLHTQYSLLDGAINLKKLFGRCKELGMDSVAITDHGNMFGAVDFYTAAIDAEVKPILGIEAYIAPGSRHDRNKSSIKEASFHLVLLAENNTGYQNLLKLASVGYTEGFYYRPRIDKEVLREFNEGIICTSACIAGEVPSLLVKGDREAAKQSVQSYLDIFGPERYFIEVQQHELEDNDVEVRDDLISLAKEMGVGMIVTNDVHFLNEQDYEAHDALCCINTGKKVNEPSRMMYPKDVFLKSPAQMREMFADIEEACDNTLAIAERCNVELDLKSQHAPNYTPADGSKPEQFLTNLVMKGAKERYGKITPEIKERIDRELEVIEGKGFSSYFLIVWDFCNFAWENNIPVGARGSAVGTVVGYCLGICNIDPIRYDLLFERFMDPARNEMPDIDIDICQDGRAKVLEYVRKKYGQIAQIITFGTMKARAVIRDVCRVLDVPLSEADRLAKLVPAELGMTLDKALEVEPDLKKSYDSDDQTRKVIEIGKRLEGLTRHVSVHACGVVIADEPLTNFLPLYKASGSDDLITQFEGPVCDKIGLLKMDFLGLRTLSIIERAVQLVEAIHNKKVEINNIDLTDQDVLGGVFGAGKTKGVFQFESGGMADLLMKLKPDRFEDLIAANALYRPGPMALIPDYIDRKHGAKWDVPHEIMREVLEETFGIMVYQEQVMRICNRLGDIPLREAYTLIKAISKKKLKLIAKEKKRFIEGSVKKGLKKQQAEEIFELIQRFAGYGFNKSHATRYSYIAFQTAYLKHYYPVEFMAALLTYEMGNSDKVVEYIEECKAMGIEVLGPDVNESFSDFTVVYNQEHEHKTDSAVIRFGLAAVKGVGVRAVERIIEARERVGRFKGLYHFCENVDLRAVNKQVIDALIKAGSFDNLGGSRAQMWTAMEKAMEVGSSMQSDLQSGQLNFFGEGGFGGKAKEKEREQLPNVDPWPEMQMLNYEKQVLGFYVSMNPLSKFAEQIQTYTNCHTSELVGRSDGSEVVVGGMVKKIRQMVTKNGKNAGAKMAVFTLEDLQGVCEVVMFPRTLEQFSELLDVDRIVFVRGKVDTSRELPNVICEELISHEEVGDKLAANVWVKIDHEWITEDKVAKLRSVCMHNRGKSPVNIITTTPAGYRICAVVNGGLKVKAGVEFKKQLEAVVGNGRVEFRRKTV